MLWGEAVDQVRNGWIAPTLALAENGRPADSPEGAYDVAFLFGEHQGGKIRACDDLKHSLTNRCCQIATPIQPVSWDHVAQLSQITALKGQELQLFKADHESYYKQLPIDHADQHSAIVALRLPSSGRRYGFRAKALVFGSTAAVLRYNVISLVLTDLVNFCLGIPSICYFEDFAALLSAILAPEAIRTFTRFCATLGISLKEGKSFVGNSVAFLGLVGNFPSPDTGMKLLVSLSPEKREERPQMLEGCLSQGRISRRRLGKLIGRLSFLHTCLFGKFARTQMRPHIPEIPQDGIQLPSFHI